MSETNVVVHPVVLPCPFCGREPEQSSRASNVNKSGEAHFLMCFCGGFSARAHIHGETAEDALREWNTRSRQDREALLVGFPNEAGKDGMEKRLIGFRTLKNCCEDVLYGGAVCTSERHPDYDGYKRGRCCQNRCPIWRRLSKPNSESEAPR